jgi:glucosamine--fructose-6-phosphate aminotransferase (isomerizing)
MCGIFGVIASNSAIISANSLNRLVKELFEQSETRGKDASGVLAIDSDEILIFKQAQRASVMLKTQNFAEVLAHAERSYLAGKAFAIAGHTRMVTNGSEDNENNNQPVVKDQMVLLHNGIIVNDLELWERHSKFQRQYQVDTEVFGALMIEGVRAGQSMPLTMKQAFTATQGANTIAAIYSGAEDIWLGTTNGSLYFWSEPTLGMSIFGSEKYILEQALSAFAGLMRTETTSVQQVKPGCLLTLSLTDGSARILAPDTLFPNKQTMSQSRKIRLLSEPTLQSQGRKQNVSNIYVDIERHMQYDAHNFASLKRCTKCLMPNTFPFIKFNAEGVCQFCLQYKRPPLRGTDALHELANKARRANGEQDCLVPISGGRDSCYGLHYIKKELGLNPVAYTYDWGFVTDLARRNVSRMCGELNVEHVLVAADIKQKRENVRKNVSAWLAKPTLSMIPLFMAGDKQFFYYATKIKKQMDLGPILYSMNWLEKTGFKSGFAGVNDTSEHEKTHGLTVLNQLKLMNHYGFNFLSNPRYINSSITDTLFGYFSFYLKAMDYYQIFDYLNWNQGEIESTIIDGYNWETSPDTKSTWRIGDGTVPFYNYIYLTIAGFTENDTFRSNQIREGMITRDEALKAIEDENRPRAEGFKWYCDTIGLDAVEALKAINKVKKLYMPIR